MLNFYLLAGHGVSMHRKESYDDLNVKFDDKILTDESMWVLDPDMS